MRARYYDPEARRFVSEDPLGLDAGVNLYAYCENNPLRLVDPLGLIGVGNIVGVAADAGLGPGASTAIGESGGTIAIVGRDYAGVGGFHTSGSFVGGDIEEHSSGAFAGAGGGFVITTANSFSEFSGPGDTWSFNIGVGPGFTVQFTKNENGVKTLAVFTRGPGIGLSFERTKTITETVGFETRKVPAGKVSGGGVQK